MTTEINQRRRKRYQVFLSSTFLDLTEQRKASIEVIVERGHIPIALERFRPKTEIELEVIKKAIQNCQVYIAIIGHRYGEIIPGLNISWTEFEYNTAKEKGLFILPFIINDEEKRQRRANLDPNNIRDIEELKNTDRLESFHQRIKMNTFYKNFSIKDNFRPLVLEALVYALEALDINQSLQSEDLAIAQFEGRIKLVSLNLDGTYNFLDETENLHNIFYLLTPETVALREAIEELESLVNNRNAKERHFQDFFERNPDFILNDGYKKAYSHVVLSRIDAEALIPDFVLEPMDQFHLCDLLDLKLPTAKIFVQKKRRKRFSAAVFEACAQLREYSLYFDEKRNQDLVFRHYGLRAYKPKMFVVIGRRGNINPFDFRRMETDVPNLLLYTYDDIINRMKSKLEIMQRI